jgi:hypothetical protein
MQSRKIDARIIAPSSAAQEQQPISYSSSGMIIAFARRFL